MLCDYGLKPKFIWHSDFKVQTGCQR